jgi:hypothetical protein
MFQPRTLGRNSLPAAPDAGLPCAGPRPPPWPASVAPLDTVWLKLTLTPVVIGGASYAGRRWGEGVGGWLVGLPLTSAPVAFFLALDQDAAFVADYARGAFLGVIAETLFCLGYVPLARSRPWPVALLAGTLLFAAAAFGSAAIGFGPAALFVAANACLALVLLLLPKPAPAGPARPVSRSDIPVRMLVATVLVLALTEAAPALGARLAAILASFPIFASTLAVFAHRQHGGGAAIAVLRGLVLGLFGYTFFFLALGLLIEPAGLAPAFIAAIVVNLSVQGLTLGWVRRHRGAG